MRLWKKVSAQALGLLLAGFVLAGEAPAQDTIEDLVDEREEEEEELQKIPGTDLEGLGRSTTKRRVRLPRKETRRVAVLAHTQDDHVKGHGAADQRFVPAGRIMRRMTPVGCSAKTR